MKNNTSSAGQAVVQKGNSLREQANVLRAFHVFQDSFAHLESLGHANSLLTRDSGTKMAENVLLLADTITITLGVSLATSDSLFPELRKDVESASALLFSRSHFLYGIKTTELGENYTVLAYQHLRASVLNYAESLGANTPIFEQVSTYSFMLAHLKYVEEQLGIMSPLSSNEDLLLTQTVQKARLCNQERTERLAILDAMTTMIAMGERMDLSELYNSTAIAPESVL